jgi:parallel beta-helix repeat protein
VDDDGGGDFSGIQEAINNASMGDTILVHSGVYYEHVYVNKSVTLKGIGQPVVAANGSGSAITLNADGITLEGFNATNSGSMWACAGIRVISGNNTITGNNVYNNRDGISVDSSSNNSITGNNASNNKYGGIYLSRSSNNTITGNTFVNDGLSVYYSYQNTVEDNIVNGKPLVYLEDASDYTVEDAGQVILVNCTNITVENLDLANTSVGVELWKTEDSKVLNNTVSNNRDGISLWNSYNNSITGNNVRSNSIGGISLSLSSNNSIKGNNVGDNNDDGISLWNSYNNSITGNTFVNDGLSVYYSYQNTVEGNIVNGKPLVYLEDASDYTVEDAGQVILVNCTNITVENLELTNTSVGIGLLNTEDSKVLNNTVSNNRDGISLWNSYNNSITGNNVNGNKMYGISLPHSSNNTIIGNSFVNCGLLVWGSDYQNTVEDNIVNGKPLLYLVDSSDYKVEDAGQVILVNCTNITVEGQDLFNTSIGIRLWTTEDSKILNNTVSNNSVGGISLDNSNNNTITGNNVRNNNFVGGISLDNSNNNYIYLNNFINNTDNLVSSGSTNIWNSPLEITYTYDGTTYTSYLGNYWDAYKGIADANGIGDMPYSIDSKKDENDDYPLMQPFENYITG